MDTFKTLLPILTAVLSALSLLGGYGCEKKLERDEAIRKTRQEIYSRLISNITERNMILGRLLDQSPEYAKAKPEEKAQVESELSAAGRLTSPELSKNEGARTEVVADLCLYGTDEAIDAYIKYAKPNVEGKGGDFGQLVQGLRHSIDKTTHLTAEDADLGIWNDPKYLKKVSPKR